MKITVNGQTKSLSLIDPKTKCDWIADFIDNGDLVIDSGGFASMSEEDYERWAPVVAEYQKADNAAYDLSLTLADPTEFLFDLADAQDRDVEDQPAAMMEVIERHGSFEKRLEDAAAIAVDTEQDYENETTKFTFVDGSSVIFNGISRTVETA